MAMVMSVTLPRLVQLLQVRLLESEGTIIRADTDDGESNDGDNDDDSDVSVTFSAFPTVPGEASRIWGGGSSDPVLTTVTTLTVIMMTTVMSVYLSQLVQLHWVRLLGSGGRGYGHQL